MTIILTHTKYVERRINEVIHRPNIIPKSFHFEQTIDEVGLANYKSKAER